MYTKKKSETMMRCKKTQSKISINLKKQVIDWRKWVGGGDTSSTTQKFKNSNYVFLLSAWSISMKICLKGIFISVQHLLVQIKVHKENVKIKRESSEAYSEPCQTSKFYLQILNGSQLLTIVFIA